MDKGAHFVRCDFQVHTPRDPNWQGSRPSDDAGRIAHAVRLVAACREKGIGAIAVSDHHDFAFFPYIRRAAEAELGHDGEPLPEQARLVVFPALELTLGVPCQALLILDADFPEERLGIVLEALAVEVVDPALGSLPSLTPLDHVQSLGQLHEELDRHSWLRGAYIVLPNVTDGGHQTLMRSHMQAKYKAMPCVGGYIDGTVETKVGQGNKRIFAGEDAAWGNKRLALVQTSDARTESFEDLGRNTSWLKWAKPTAEAIRQACLAQESRISHAEPEHPTTFVTRLRVSNSTFMGPIELELNPQYNAIIGGRGTGKSTCLEYLRWALCDQPGPMPSDSDVPDHAVRRQRLIETTLSSIPGHVEVHFILNGIQHVVRRYSERAEILLKVGQEDFREVTEEDVRSLLPVHAYSQKQLSSVAVRIDEIARFVTAPIRRDLEQVGAKAATLASRTRENYAALQRQRTLSNAIHRDRLNLSSAQQQAENLRGSLGALSDSDRETLASRSGFETADHLVSGWQRRLGQAREYTRELVGRIDGLRGDLEDAGNQSLPEAALLAEIRAEVEAALASLRTAAHQAEQTFANVSGEGSTYDSASKAWAAARDRYELEYSDAKARSASHESTLAELEAVERAARELQQTLDQENEELESLGDPTSAHGELRAEWIALRNERAVLLEVQCGALTDLSDGLIKATLVRGAGLTNLSESFRGAITGSGVRGAKIDGFFELLSDEADPVGAWEDALSELEPSSLERPTPTLSRLGLSGNDVEKIASRLTPEGWLDIALSSVDDHPKFEYKSKEGEYIDFAVASAGQQATALLTVLLNQGGPPLIIDQPEDDLDSQVLLDVVAKIWAAKARRQLVFSSHNANLVVNGDAELVVCCDYRAAGDQSGGQIKLLGAIDIDDVRNEITVVMEGGEKAFKLRKEKYGF